MISFVSIITYKEAYTKFVGISPRLSNVSKEGFTLMLQEDSQTSNNTLTNLFDLMIGSIHKTFTLVDYYADYFEQRNNWKESG